MLSHKGRQMLVFFAFATLYSFGEYAHHMNIEKNTICVSETVNTLRQERGGTGTNLYTDGQRVEPICNVGSGPELRSCHETIRNNLYRQP